MSGMSNLPEGWYTDPAAANPSLPTTMRYWDGRQWTARVRGAKKAEVAAWRRRVAEQQRELALASTASTAASAGASAGAPGARAGAAVPGAYAGATTYSTGFASERDVTPDGQRLAGWWRRAVAVVVDSVVVTVLTVVVGWHLIRSMMQGVEQLALAGQQTAQTGAAPLDQTALQSAVVSPLLGLLLVAVLIRFAYAVGFLKAFGATPGKMVVGIEVRRRDRPGPLPWGTVLLRWVAFDGVGLIPLVGGALNLIDVLWPLWDGRRQALHDKLAGTSVVRSRG